MPDKDDTTAAKEGDSKADIMKGMKKFFNKSDIKTFNNSEGKDLKDDVRVNGLESSLLALEEAISITRETAETPEMWDFEPSIFEGFGKTREDLLIAYLRWSLKIEIPDDAEKQAELELDVPFNVSKTVRRLKKYAEWMHRNQQYVTEAPMVKENFRDIYMNMACFMSSTHSVDGCVLWFIDVDRNKEFTKLSHSEFIRIFCFNLHCLMFDEQVQRRGCIIIEDLAYIGFSRCMKSFPAEAKKETDRLMQGAGAIKMHKFVIMRSPWWFNAMMKMMALFLSKKIRSRIALHHKKWEVAASYAGGLQYFPSGFGKGGMDEACVDRVFGHDYPWECRIEPNQDPSMGKKASKSGRTMHPEGFDPGMIGEDE